MADEAALGSMGRVALKWKGGTWSDGSPASLGAGDAIPVESEDLRREDVKEADRSLVGQVHERAPVRVASVMRNRPVVFVGDYNYLTRPLAFATGTAGAPTEEEAGVRYAHRFQLHDNMQGVVATIGVDRVIDASGSSQTTSGIRFAAAKANGFTLTFREGQKVRLSVPWHGRDFADEIDASSWTFPQNVNTGMQYALLSHGVLRINAQGGAGLGSGDVLALPVELEVTYRPNLDGVLDSGGLGEPFMRSRPSTRLRVRWPRWTQALRTSLLAAYEARSALKADFTLTGPALGNANHALVLSFPFLTIDSDLDPSLADPDVVPLDVEFHAQQATAAPTGMTGITRPVDITLRNAVSANPLA